MNYTENYHLPQWEENDRIMRVDFNRAMANIDGGLRGAGENLENTMSDVQKQLDEVKEADCIFRRRFFRLMYNHYSMLRTMDPFPRQLGVFYQNPARDTSVSYPGVVWRDGAAYMVNSTAPASPDALFNSIVETQSLQLVKGDLAASQPQIWSFQTSAPGMFYKVRLCTSHDNNSSSAVPLQLLCELKNLDTGEVDWTQWLRLDLDSSNANHAHDTDFNIPFHGGCRYQLTMTPLNAPANGVFLLNLVYGYTLVRFFQGSPGAAFTQGCYNFEEYSEGLVILRCRSGGKGGSITFQWNGEVMEPVKVRNIAQEGMWKIQEYFYYRKGAMPKVNEFSVSFRCNPNGEFWFYDWGGIFC